MSRRRKPGRHPWVPWIGQTRDSRPVQDRIRQSTKDTGRTRIDAYGADAGALAAIDAFRKAGATRIELGWDAPGYAGADDAPVGVEVTWWFRVTFPGRVEHGRSSPTTNHALGILDAAAQILRHGGATVTVEPDWAN